MKIENLHKAANLAKHINESKSLLKDLKNDYPGEESHTLEVSFRYALTGLVLTIPVEKAIQITEERIQKLIKEVALL